ncbi:MAG: hypothetical protein F6K19_49790, partial [Cyanothece sp. SIO1E1]|nr:hypothetical protein [Cyanothece sp. SIO1E1]
MQFDLKLGEAYINCPKPQIAEIVSEINRRSQQQSYAWWIVGTTLVFASLLGLFGHWGVSVGLLTIGALVAWFHHQQTQRARLTTLHYQLDDDFNNRFEAIHQAFRTLAKSEKIWLEATRQQLQNQHRNSVASQAIKFSQISVQLRCSSPPFIQTNLDIWSLDIGYLTLFFLPDYVLMLRRGLYSAISYSSVEVGFKPMRVNIQGDLPTDTKVTGYTWLYVTPEGKPDPQVRNNPRFLQVQYGFLQILV